MRLFQLVVATVGLLASCQGLAQIPETSSQLLLTITEDWDADTGVMYQFERAKGGWEGVAEPVPVNIGRTGLAWGIGLHPQQQGPQKREGDGKAPAGIFRLGDAFGYAPTVETGLAYWPMKETHFCVDVPESPLYNRTVDAEEVGRAAVEGSSEGMRRDIHYGDQQYKKGIFVAHNPENQPGAGSCIFIHLWKAPGAPTAGCTAFAEPQMDRVLARLQRGARPLYVALPRAEYLRLRDSWSLPALPVGDGDSEGNSLR
ncbi:L,D-transpeptidase [Microbulbifer sp. JSM ZJ756]|uniref:L,D-transpeptidase n=1 Tax=Microbulbifer sp. JSM ZJ756 TaxID=3376191 RepID=UPI00378BD7FC